MEGVTGACLPQPRLCRDSVWHAACRGWTRARSCWRRVERPAAVWPHFRKQEALPAVVCDGHRCARGRVSPDKRHPVTLLPHHCHGPSVGVVSRAVTTNPQALRWSNKKKKTVLIFKSFLSKKLDTSCLGTPCSRAATKGAVHGCHTVLCHCAYARTCSLLSCGVDRVRAGSPPAQTTPAMSLRWHWPPAVHTGTMAKGPAPHTDAALAVGCRRQQIPGEPGRGLLRPEAQVHLQVPSPEAQPAAEPGPGWGGAPAAEPGPGWGGGPAAELGPERPGLGRPSPGRPGPGWGGGPCR